MSNGYGCHTLRRACLTNGPLTNGPVGLQEFGKRFLFGLLVLVKFTEIAVQGRAQRVQVKLGVRLGKGLLQFPGGLRVPMPRDHSRLLNRLPLAPHQRLFPANPLRFRQACGMTVGKKNAPCPVNRYGFIDSHCIACDRRTWCCFSAG